jgi:hypothetical protein
VFTPSEGETAARRHLAFCFNLFDELRRIAPPQP